MRQAFAAPGKQALREFQTSICDDWFASQSSFICKVAMSSIILPDCLVDSMYLRAFFIFMHFGLVRTVTHCPHCKAPSKLASRQTKKDWATLLWTCSSQGHKHLDENVNNHGILQGIPIASWMAFLNMIVLMRLERPWKEILQEISSAYGPTHKGTVRVWRKSLQGVLRD